MITIEIAADNLHIQVSVGKRKVFYQFEEQVAMFHLVYRKLLKNVAVYQVDDNTWFLDIREPFATFIYRWLKGIEEGTVLTEDIEQSVLLDYIHGEV